MCWAKEHGVIRPYEGQFLNRRIDDLGADMRSLRDHRSRCPVALDPMPHLGRLRLRLV